MKSVVMVAHDFPPEGSAGVYRPLRFVRQLPALQWRPLVVACNKYICERYDPKLLALVPADVVVHRIPAPDPWQAVQALRARRLDKKLARYPATVRERVERGFESPARRHVREFVRRVESWCYHPDLAMTWIRPATRAVVRLCSSARVHVICASAGPVSAFVVAYRASRRTGVPYVLDFRDAWTITHNDFDAKRPIWATRRDRQLFYRMLTTAHAVVFRYHAEAECYWRAYEGALDPSRIHIIPNGYEGEIETSPTARGDRCRVVYTGTLSSYRYDTLLEALRQLKQQDPGRAALLSVTFVGESSDAAGREAEALDIRDVVGVRGPVSHSETADLHRDAHALLALGRPSTMKGYELFAGAKVFEYLKAGRPIVAVLPQDETRGILDRVGVSTIADVESPSEVVAVLSNVIDAWRAGALDSLVPDKSALEVYSAEHQGAALARAFEGAPAVDPFVPGAVSVPASLRSDIESDSWIRHPKKGTANPIAAQ